MNPKKAQAVKRNVKHKRQRTGLQDHRKPARIKVQEQNAGEKQ